MIFIQGKVGDFNEKVALYGRNGCPLVYGDSYGLFKR